MAPSDPSDTVLAVCLRVRQSGALRVFVALGRIILDFWAAPPQCGYRGSMGSFCSAPQDFGLLGFFCARFPPREASLLIGGGREVGLRGALSPLENGDRERWPPHPGYSQLGGVGQVEPDK